ncbi:MAG TPA: DNA repair exonuclease [Gemmatimonadales bacterium]|nr:DNA repair exonuclease [Gemmatimonadales bacterium]
MPSGLGPIILHRVKIAHIADPHLGIRQYHRQTSGGINQREADVANAFRSAMDGVIAARPDAVVIAGDLFHSVRPTNAAIVFAFRQFQRLREALPDAPIVLIAGNHDTPRSVETGSILRLYEELGISVAAGEARRFTWPERDLSIFAVPHDALVAETRPALRPEGAERYQVLVIHGDMEGVIPGERSFAEYGGAPITRAELGASEWSYVAFGHYHVQHEIAPRVWYAGALEYVSTNIWGELAEEQERRLPGKGWLLADLDSGTVTPQPIAGARRVIDLEPLEGAGRSAAELDADIASRAAGVDGGIRDRIVRLVVRNVPRHVARELDHAAIRALRSEALHFHLDIRRPELNREVGVGAPGRRRTLPEIVRDYLARRPLPSGIDRERFVSLGADLVESVAADQAD